MEIVAILVFFIGFFGLITSPHIIKSVVYIIVMETSAVMFFLTIGFQRGMTAPIGEYLENAADPLSQALMITAIIIGVAVTAINITLLIILFRKYQTTNWDIAKNLSKRDRS